MNARARAKEEARIGGVPGVDLRPPSLIVREQDRSKLSWAILLFVLVVVAIGAVAMIASTRRTAAEAELAAAQAELQAVLESQTMYADVREVQLSAALLDSAASVAAQHEVDWARVVRQLLAPLPDDVVIGDISAFAPGVAEPAPAPESVLGEPRVATLKIVLSAPSLERMVQYIRALDRMPIITEVSTDSVIDGRGTLTVGLSEVALTNRFADGLESGSDSTSQGTTSEVEQ
jgi:hypothetical protein